MVVRWLVPFLAAGGLVGFLELADYYPASLNWYGFLAAIWPILFSVFFLLELRRRRLPIHNFAVPFLALVAGAVLLFVFVDRPILRQAVIALSGLMVFLDLFCLAISLRPAVNQLPRIMEQYGSVVSILSLFYLFVVLFGWTIFLANIFWPAALLAFGIAWLLGLEYLAARRIEVAKAAFVSLVLGLLMAEFFWVISLWPLGFLVKGWVLTLIMLNCLAVAAAYLQKQFDRKKTVINMAVSAALIILVVSFARWL